MTPLERALAAMLAATFAWAGCGRALPGPSTGTAPARVADRVVIRVNQLAYLPDGRKVAVLCSLDPQPEAETFFVLGESGDTVLGPLPAESAGAFGPCRAGFRLDFSGPPVPSTGDSLMRFGLSMLGGHL